MTDIPEFEKLAAMAGTMGEIQLEAIKPTGAHWGAYWTREGEERDVLIAQTDGPKWATWFALLHNAAPAMVLRILKPGPQWTMTPKFVAGTWLARSATGTSLIFWDGRDDVPHPPTNLPTQWFGPIPNPPY